jgi:16S rRNA (guanine527-N7)-methyltransferase
VKKTAEPADLLRQGLQDLGLDLKLQPPLMAYLGELLRWNGAYNLTAVRDPAQMVTRHLLDSLALLPHLKQPELRLLDIGSGAGLPGIPLAIARPLWQVWVLDSNGKKARFLRHVQRSLGLHRLTVVEARVEEYRMQELADVIVSRAFASLADFIRLSGHLLKDDGRWLAMKGRVDDNETAETPGGVRIEQVIPLQVPGLPEQRHLIVASRLPPHLPRP